MRACVMRDGGLVVARGARSSTGPRAAARPHARLWDLRVGSPFPPARAGHGGSERAAHRLARRSCSGARARRSTSDRDIVMGHEFCAEVLETGPDTSGPAPGTPVVSVPVLLTETGLSQLAYNNDYPGGFAERMLLSAPLVLSVPNGFEPRIAALTEPLAVGVHAVAAAGVTARNAAAVVGCGPVGLAVIAALRIEGVEVIVASDFSPATTGARAASSVPPRSSTRDRSR